MGDLAQTTNDNNEETKGTPFEIWSLLVLFQSRLLLVFQFSDMGLFLFLFFFLFFRGKQTGTGFQAGIL